MEAKISETELAQRLTDILNRVHDRGEAFLIERNGEAVATLRPAKNHTPFTWRTFAERLRDVRTDDPAFADDLEDVQRNQPGVLKGARRVVR